VKGVFEEAETVRAVKGVLRDRGADLSLSLKVWKGAVWVRTEVVIVVLD
jgi:hypothetical protein